MDTIVLLASVPAIVAVVNLAKRLGLSGEASLALAVVLGVIFALGDHLWGTTGWYAAASQGLILGLGAAGLYDVTAPATVALFQGWAREAIADIRGRDVPVRTAAIRYASLAVLIMTASFGMLTALLDIGIATLPAKILADATLFLVSFSVQRAVVFAPRERPIERAHTGMNARVESLS